MVFRSDHECHWDRFDRRGLLRDSLLSTVSVRLRLRICRFFSVSPIYLVGFDVVDFRPFGTCDLPLRSFLIFPTSSIFSGSSAFHFPVVLTLALLLITRRGVGIGTARPYVGVAFAGIATPFSDASAIEGRNSIIATTTNADSITITFNLATSNHSSTDGSLRSFTDQQNAWEPKLSSKTRGRSRLSKIIALF